MNDVMVLKNLIDIRSGLVDIKTHQDMIVEIDKSISILVDTLLPLLIYINQSNDYMKDYLDLCNASFINNDLASDKLEIDDVWVD